MKIHPISDLHLEISNYMPSEASEQADVIVIAGDAWKNDHGVAWARATWPNKRIIYVAGNHEFYGRDRKTVLKNIRIAAEENGVDFLDNEAVIIDGVRFLGATLWTDFNLYGKSKKRECMQEAMHSVQDFSVIQEGEWILSPQDSVNLHLESVYFLEDQLRKAFKGPTVVVTHHLPAWNSVALRWRPYLMSACFASRLDKLIKKYKIDLWVHGHTHNSFDYYLSNTRVICNPRGYTRFEGGEENNHFNNSLIITV